MKKRIQQFAGGMLVRAANFLGYTPELFSAIGGRSFGVSSSGVTVTTETALKVAAWKRGIQLISDYIGKTPYHVKRDGLKDKQHPAWMLVRRWSNYHVVSAREFRRTMAAIALARGNSVAFIVRESATAVPVELRILPPNTCRPVKAAGGIRYKIEGRSNTVSPSDVIHIKGFSLNAFWGDDPISGYARDVLGLSIAGQNYAAGYYEHGGLPTKYAHAEHVLQDDEYNTINKRLNDSGGLANRLSNAHDIPICEGFELKDLSPTAEQTQLLESREFSLTDIANALGISVHKLQGKRNSSYKSLEEENRAFGDDTLDPFFCQFEEQYAKLLTEAEQQTEAVKIEAVRESLQRTNAKDKALIVSKATGGAPWLEQDEARELYDLPPSTKLPTPLYMQQQTDDDEAKDSDDERSNQTLAKQQAAVASVFARMGKRLSTQLRRAAAKPDTFGRFVDQLDERNRQTVAEALQPVVALVRDSIDCEAVAAEYLNSFRAVLPAADTDDFSSAAGTIADRWERSHDTHAAQLLALKV